MENLTIAELQIRIIELESKVEDQKNTINLMCNEHADLAEENLNNEGIIQAMLQKHFELNQAIYTTINN